MKTNNVNVSCYSSARLSLLQGEEVFANRILSRSDCDSKCFSSRILYYLDRAGQVPFEWEAQPGQPKVVPESSPLPPLNPPPAVLSSILAKETHSLPKPGSKRSKNRFWKKSRKTPESVQKTSSEYDHVVEYCKSDSSGLLWRFERDYNFSSPRYSSSSSSSFSSSSFSSGCPSPVRKFPGMNLPPPAQSIGVLMVGHASNTNRK